MFSEISNRESLPFLSLMTRSSMVPGWAQFTSLLRRRAAAEGSEVRQCIEIHGRPKGEVGTVLLGVLCAPQQDAVLEFLEEVHRLEGDGQALVVLRGRWKE